MKRGTKQKMPHGLAPKAIRDEFKFFKNQRKESKKPNSISRENFGVDIDLYFLIASY